MSPTVYLSIYLFKKLIYLNLIIVLMIFIRYKHNLNSFFLHNIKSQCQNIPQASNIKSQCQNIPQAINGCN